MSLKSLLPLSSVKRVSLTMESRPRGAPPIFFSFCTVSQPLIKEANT